MSKELKLFFALLGLLQALGCRENTVGRWEGWQVINQNDQIYSVPLTLEVYETEDEERFEARFMSPQGGGAGVLQGYWSGTSEIQSVALALDVSLPVALPPPSPTSSGNDFTSDTEWGESDFEHQDPRREARYRIDTPPLKNNAGRGACVLNFEGSLSLDKRSIKGLLTADANNSLCTTDIKSRYINVQKMSDEMSP